MDIEASQVINLTGRHGLARGTCRGNHEEGLSHRSCARHLVCPVVVHIWNNERRTAWLTTPTALKNWPKPIARTWCARLHSSGWPLVCLGVEA